MKNRRWVPAVVGLAVAAVIVVVLYLVVTQVYTLDRLEVTGNEIYTQEQISNTLLSDEHAWSTLYVYFKYKYKKDIQIPFIDAVEVSLKDPHTIAVTVYEKGILGYLYIDSVGQNAYFDKDGFVAEISSSVIEGVPAVTGLEVGNVVLYEKLDLADATKLNDLLLLAGLLKKYEIAAETVAFSVGDMTVDIDGVHVDVGTSDHLTEKIMRLERILPILKEQGLTGTLHLENWSAQTGDIIFDKD